MARRTEAENVVGILVARAPSILVLFLFILNGEKEIFKSRIFYKCECTFY